jgi:hypothetical protein
MRLLLVSVALALAPAPEAGASTGHVPFEATFVAEQPGRWDFGDGTSAEGAVVRHVYTEPGLYAVTLDGVVREHVGAFRVHVAAEQVGRIAGRIEPALVRAPVEAAGVRGETGRDGSFSLRLAEPGRFRARVGPVESREVQVMQSARLEARLAGSGLVGDRLRVVARARPARAGRIAFRVVRGTLSGKRPGPVEVRVKLLPAPGWLTAAKTLRTTVVLPRLASGSRGTSVRSLERRLRELRFALPRVDALYGLDTYQAVLAFQKLNGLPWTGRVDAQTWRALRRARRPAPRHRGTHIEVSKGRQVLLVVRDSRVTDVVHVSTGATGNTPIGTWRIYRKVTGWDWVLWYPMYFLRGFAVHGYPDVPAYPASHGCVRVPMWIAPRLYASFGRGQRVHVYW